MKKIFSILALLLLLVAFYPQKVEAKVCPDHWKACPDFNDDTCCETGHGNCAPPVVIGGIK